MRTFFNTRENPIAVFVAIVAFVAVVIFGSLVISEYAHQSNANNSKTEALSEKGAERYFNLCGLVSSMQTQIIFYQKIKKDDIGSDVRSKVAKQISELEDKIAIVVEGYNDSMVKHKRSEAKSFNIPYELTYKKLNSCVYGS